ncbi:MAG: hypothetical protein HOB82_00145 [Alphaproteobacteria bacterium]|jgi:hypothetical protein|nr:hypothetical protein [Alphaproteobacteria bacterium]MBT5860181.1 hypothetical protein [Alphaproteobacteria bacterium]
MGRTRNVALMAFGVCLGFWSGAALAQDDGRDAWLLAPCSSCHGTFADGVKEDGGSEFPDGPSLRRTRLDPEEILMTVRCGRPGTPMPSFDPGAYTEFACHDLPLGPRPETLFGFPPMDDRTILEVVDFLVANFVGKGRVTRDECTRLLGRADLCGEYR